MNKINCLNNCDVREGDRLLGYSGNEYRFLNGKMESDNGLQYDGEPVVLIANKYMEEEGMKRKVIWVDKTQFSYDFS